MALRFDDIDGINANISEDWGEWGPTFEMTQEKVNLFAELTGDHQWIHVDIERANARDHLAFGWGTHYCVGAHLARAELRVAFRVLLERLDDIELARPLDPLPHEFSFFLRPLKELPIRFSTAG